MSRSRIPSKGLRPTEISVDPPGLPGLLRLPDGPRGLVIFAHGSGSSRLSPRNNLVAESLAEGRLATLLFDLLTEEEESDRANVFDISLLSERLIAAIDWSRADPATAALPIGLFGASTGAAATLVAAAADRRIDAVVSRGGRPDLAGRALALVRAPTLLIVGGADAEVLRLNELAYAELAGPKELVIVPGATHLFPEPGALELVVDDAQQWFIRHLGRSGATEQWN
jgi:putative phosphoribosyl transferase